MDDKPRVHPAKVEAVLSGDDLILMIDLEVEGLHKRQRVRLNDVDTPNAVRQGPHTEAGKVRDAVARLCKDRPLRATVVSQTANAWIVVLEVHMPDDSFLNLNEFLIDKGYAYGRVKND